MSSFDISVRADGTHLESFGSITGGKIFQDQDFTTASLEREMQNRDYDIVHLATHAVFKRM
ncbi:CHAT domain-containing protein [Desulfonema limicola]|uniref:CHAT domain-containing protein n=1 Tax=Desulfonema limicola TaxID=45656 RepID=UPI001A9B0B52